MRNKGARRSSLRELFAERRVHVRSGTESRYVVLSPGLQIGVALGGIALAILLGLTTYNALSGRLALIDQQRTLADLSAQATDAEAARDQLAALQERNDDAEGEIARLTAALAAAQDDSDARATVAALEAEFADSAAKNEELVAALAEVRAGRESDAAARSAELEDLRAEVTGLRAEIERLEREAQSRRPAAAPTRQTPPPDAGSDTPLEAPAGGETTPSLRIAIAAEPAAREVRQIQQELADAQATIDALSADLEAAKNPRPGSGPTRPATITADDLSRLKAQLSAANQRAEQLGVSLVAPPADVASDAATDRVPLPPPPAPR